MPRLSWTKVKSELGALFVLLGCVVLTVGCGEKPSRSERARSALENAVAVLRLEPSENGFRLAEVIKADDSFRLRQRLGDSVRISAAYQENVEGFVVVVGPFVETDLFDFPMSFGEYPVDDGRVSGLNHMTLEQIRTVVENVNLAATTDESVEQAGSVVASKPAPTAAVVLSGVVGLLLVLWLGLTVFAVISCARHEKRTTPLVVWMMVIFWITPIGPVVYLLLRSLPRRMRLSPSSKS